MKHAFLILFAIIATTAVPVSAGEQARLLALHDTPVPVPNISFADEAGASHSLADFRGKLVLLNIWATWCVPCRTEMPTLDRLQAILGGPDFEVVALSIDRGGPEVVRKFFDEISIQHLAVSIDTSTGAAFELGTVGLPATLLIDRDGMEIGRLIGPAEWDSEEMVSTLKPLIAWSRAAATPQPKRRTTLPRTVRNTGLAAPVAIFIAVGGVAVAQQPAPRARMRRPITCRVWRA